MIVALGPADAPRIVSTDSTADESVEPDERALRPPDPRGRSHFARSDTLSLRDLFLSDLPPGESSALDKAKAGGTSLAFGAALAAGLHAFAYLFAGLALSAANQSWAGAFGALAWLCGHLAVLHFTGPTPPGA